MDLKRKGLIGLPQAGDENKDGSGRDPEVEKESKKPARTGKNGKRKTGTVLLIVLAGVLLAAGLPALFRAGSGGSGTASKTESTPETAPAVSAEDPAVDPSFPNGQRAGAETRTGTEEAGESGALVLLPEPDAGTPAVKVEIRPKEGTKKDDGKPEVSSYAAGSDKDGKKTEGSVTIKQDPETSLSEQNGQTPVTGEPAELKPVVQPGSDNPFEDFSGDDESDLPEKTGSALFGEESPGEGKHF